jgi:hypothetical protein
MIGRLVWGVLMSVAISGAFAEGAGAKELPERAIVHGKRIQPQPAPNETRQLPSSPGFQSLLDKNAGDKQIQTLPLDLYGRPLQFREDPVRNTE